MSSFMIDENKNLVSDKLWEFFATPFNMTNDLVLTNSFEIGDIMSGVCDTILNAYWCNLELVNTVPSGSTFLIRKKLTNYDAYISLNDNSFTTITNVFSPFDIYVTNSSTDTISINSLLIDFGSETNVLHVGKQFSVVILRLS